MTKTWCDFYIHTAVVVQFLNSSIEVDEPAVSRICVQLIGNIERTVSFLIRTADSPNTNLFADQGSLSPLTINKTKHLSVKRVKIGLKSYHQILASPGIDFIALSTESSFSPEDDQIMCYELTILHDQVVEHNEMLLVEIVATETQVLSPFPNNQLNVTILDNDCE